MPAFRSIFSSISTGRERVVGSTVYADNRPVGLIRPSTLEGRGADGRSYIHGPEGIAVVLNPHSPTEIFEALVASGSILFGGAEDIATVLEQLADPSSSRTTAYFSCVAPSCEMLLVALSAIRRSRVFVLGCGGIGSLVAVQLAGAGIGQLTLADGDRVELSNLNRQFFLSRVDVGQLKVEVLRTALLKRFSLRCDIIAHQVDESNINAVVADHNAAVLTADEPIGLSVDGLEARAAKTNIPWVGAGYTHHHAVVRLAVPTQTTDVFSVQESRMVNNPGLESDPIWYRLPHFIGPSFGPMNVEIAGKVAFLLLHVLGFPTLYHDGGRLFQWCPWMV